MADDEAVSQFLAFTACQDTDMAASYLEMSGGNVEMAVGLFMEHGGSGDTSSNGLENHANSNNTEAATSSSSQLNQNLVSDSGDVRAPDPTRRERLVHFGNTGHDNFLTSSLLGQALHNQSMSASSRTHAFADPMDVDADATTEDVREQVNQAAASSDGNSNDVASSSSIKKQNGPVKLADMFAPPTHILHRAGGFQGARNRAKDERRWLLVNLQADSDFACHALNRDVWGNDLVEALITSSFIFWQAMNDTGDGATYIQRYSVNAFPHVAIIDPRTGRLMWRKEGWTQVDPMTSEQFAQAAADFCSQHSFDRPPAINTAGFRPNRPTKRPVEDLSEQEQLEKAIRESQGLDVSMDDDSVDYNSIEDGDGKDDVDGDDDDDDDVEIVPPPAVKLKSDKSLSAESASSTQKPPPKEKTFEEIIAEMDIGEEPTENGAIIQFRMPDGGKIVRKFKKEDSVKIIYAFVAQSNEDAKKGISFELKAGFPPKDLFSKMDESIQSCNLSGESITVRWK